MSLVFVLYMFSSLELPAPSFPAPVLTSPGRLRPPRSVPVPVSACRYRWERTLTADIQPISRLKITTPWGGGTVWPCKHVIQYGSIILVLYDMTNSNGSKKVSNSNEWLQTKMWYVLQIENHVVLYGFALFYLQANIFGFSQNAGTPPLYKLDLADYNRQ